MTAQAATPASPKAAPEGGETLARLRQGMALPPRYHGEDRLLFSLVLVSALVHSVFLVIDDFGWVRDPTVVTEEWSMDADLVNDFERAAPAVSALPKAQEAPEAKVPDQMLPQLPKKFAVPEQAKPEEAIAEEKVEEPPKEEAKPEAPKEEQLNLKTEEQEVNKLTQADALKRLAMERLRLEEKTAKDVEAPERDSLARLAEEIQKRKKLNSGTFGSAAAKAKAKQYGATLKQAVNANYSLPEAYNLKGANLKVLIAIAVSERGDLLDLTVNQSSGDRVFDELTVQAVRASAPLPRPPKEMAGEQIVLMFTP
jgi:TonB family protein